MATNSRGDFPINSRLKNREALTKRAVWGHSGQALKTIIEDWVFVAASGGGDITGTSANTQRAQTSAASGSIRVSGSGAGTQRAQTSTASGTLRVSGSSANTQRAQTSAATATIRVSGTSAGSQRAQTSTASGTVGSSDITGTSANTQRAATSTGTGTVQILTPEGGGMLPRPTRKKSKPVVIRLPKARREVITGTGEGTQRPAISTGSGRIIVSGTGASRIAPVIGTGTGWVENEEDLALLLALVE